MYAVYEKLNLITSPPSGVSQVAQRSNPQTGSSIFPSNTPSDISVSQSFKDGEYTGDTVDAYYGNVQVKAVISRGKITDVQFLQYPNDRRTSIEINTMAMPYLKQEAIQAQIAQVDIVSGATQTSLAFQKSLQAAFNKAK